MHRTRTCPLIKTHVAATGRGEALTTKAASINCFLELSQLEVKLDILVSQFLEEVGTSNELRNSLHLAKVASRLSSVKKMHGHAVTLKISYKFVRKI